MNHIPVKIILFTFVLFVSCSTNTENWTHFRGSTMDGHSMAQNPPTKWDETKNVKWKVPVEGKGWSSPVIYGNQIWVTSAIEKEKEFLALCYDFKTGELLHKTTVFKVEELQHIHPTNSHATPTPCIEDGFVYVHYGTYGSACINTSTFEIVWQRTDMKCEHMQGAASSPVLYNDFLIVHIEGTDVQYVAALDKHTGKTVWKTHRPKEFQDKAEPVFRKAYLTPLVVNVEGVDLLISNGAQLCIAYEAQTGKEVWRFFYGEDSTVSQPFYYNGIVFINSGWVLSQGTPFFSRLFAVDPTGEGLVTDTHMLWWTEKNVPQTSTPVVVNGSIYMIEERGNITCLDAITGQIIWEDELKGQFNASPIYAGGNIYFTNVKGKTSVIKPGEKFHLVAENQVGEMVKATPAILRDKVVIRSEKSLFCIGK